MRLFAGVVVVAALAAAALSAGGGAVPATGTGLCRRAHLPPMRLGKNAASLSSGGMTTPRRSNVRKSSVRASATRGPRPE